MTDHPDIMTMTVGGRVYSGWQSLRVSRGIDRCVSDFHFDVQESWTGHPIPWKIQPFDPCQIAIDGTVIVTGYVDDYDPSFSGTAHQTKITGRSKTQDLVDCTPDVPAGQYSGYSMAAIARAICKLFTIDVIVQASGAANTFADAQFERSETAFTFLERLGRLSGVLLSDDELGRLVLTTAGSARAAGDLAEGRNIQAATAKLSAKKRFSDYIVKGQGGISGATNWEGFGDGAAPIPAATVQTQMHAHAHDSNVPRYRPRVILAESALTQAGMQLRANWLRNAAYGNATKAEITVAGWRQPDGKLWTVNQIIPVNSPTLGVNQDLLIARVEFELSAGAGRTTKLHLGPVEGFTPDPGQVKVHKPKKGASETSWTGFGH